MHHTATKGNIGVAKATADLLIKGWDVLVPVCPTSPFDLVIYKNNRFFRIQVKYRTPDKRGWLECRARRQSIAHGKVIKTSANGEFDIVCVYDGKNDRCYYVPASRGQVNLRTVAPKNNQRNRIAFAEDFLDLPV